MELASRIDHTILKAEATPAQVQQIVAEALRYHFASVCVNPIFIAEVAKQLHGSSVKTCAVIGFPLGANKLAVKAAEAAAAVRDGAGEIDMVAHLPYLLAKDFQASKMEFATVVQSARAVRAEVVVKVILETAALMAGVEDAAAEDRIECACRAAREAGCNFVKTSTGYHPAGGATAEAVKLLKKHGKGLSVKASGGIRTTEEALKLVAAGADRLGCSASVEIVRGLKAPGSATGGY